MKYESAVWNRLVAAACSLLAVTVLGATGCASTVDEDDPSELGDDEPEAVESTEQALSTCATICTGGGGRVCMRTGTAPSAVICAIAGAYACEQLCNGKKTGIPKRVCRSPGSTRDPRKCVLWDNLPWRTPRKCVGWAC
jgi:hypothetical protein